MTILDDTNKYLRRPGMLAPRRYLDDDSTLIPDAGTQGSMLKYLEVPTTPEYENIYV